MWRTQEGSTLSKVFSWSRNTIPKRFPSDRHTSLAPRMRTMRSTIESCPGSLPAFVPAAQAGLTLAAMGTISFAFTSQRLATRRPDPGAREPTPRPREPTLGLREPTPGAWGLTPWPGPTEPTPELRDKTPGPRVKTPGPGDLGPETRPPGPPGRRCPTSPDYKHARRPERAQTSSSSLHLALTDTSSVGEGETGNRYTCDSETEHAPAPKPTPKPAELILQPLAGCGWRSTGHGDPPAGSPAQKRP